MKSDHAQPTISRRQMLAHSTLGFGAVALADLLARDGALASEHGAIRPVSPRAKRVIFLFMGGGPSQVDTFDPKPELNRLSGQDVPESIAKDIPRIARSPLVNLLGSPFKFQPHGQSGIEVSSLYPELAQCVDDLCLIRSMRHSSPIHAPAEFIATTGTGIGDRPSLGAWISYGLGSENDNLPSFIILKQGETIRPPTIGSGFLPAQFQGTLVDGEKGIPHISLPAGMSPESRRRQLDLIGQLNRKHAAHHEGNSELEARIQSYELSFRMQTEAPQVFDVSQESAETLALYGLDRKETAEFGRYCLLARRLVERGVRFVQLRSGGWDAHSKLRESHGKTCLATDRPIAALLKDLKRRGLWSETLVIWGAEFGRTPAVQGGGDDPGRDHSPSGYTMWLAGGGVKGGRVIGATDPVGYAAVERPVHPNDLHATILAVLGIEQRALFYERHNRREIVTVNGGKVVEEVF
jgi:uncharacterized protein DUF1501